MNGQNYKNVCPKFFFLKIHEQILLYPRTFLLLFYIEQREDAHR